VIVCLQSARYGPQEAFLKLEWKLGLAVPSLAFSFILLAQDQSAGETIYRNKCGGCHSLSGEKRAGAALKSSKMSESEMAGLLRRGKAGMKTPHGKGMSGLNDEQVKEVVHYLKSIK
jgi:mono/diheme cytochrome c family protein